MPRTRGPPRGNYKKAILSYGIIIPVAKAIALLNALRKVPLPPGRSSSTEWGKSEITDFESWFRYQNEISGRIRSQFAASISN